MPTILWIVIALVTGGLAARKGYNFLLWAVAGGVLGLIVLSLLPFANNPDKSPEEQLKLRKDGNTVGAVIAVLGGILLLAFLAGR